METELVITENSEHRIKSELPNHIREAEEKILDVIRNRLRKLTNEIVTYAPYEYLREQGYSMNFNLSLKSEVIDKRDILDHDHE